MTFEAARRARGNSCTQVPNDPAGSSGGKSDGRESRRHEKRQPVSSGNSNDRNFESLPKVVSHYWLRGCP